jgi:carbonic anhydrase
VKRINKFVNCGLQIKVNFQSKVNLYEFKGKTCNTTLFHFHLALREAQHVILPPPPQ